MAQNINLKLAAIGGLGLMLSPSAKHLMGDNAPATFLRVFDRGTQSSRHTQARAQWQQHGAESTQDYAELVGDGDLDGIVICAGKNNDDLVIFQQLLPLLNTLGKKPFILHMSTISVRFAQTLHAVCAEHDIVYANYPLTGGPAGAESAGMLVLASGDEALYQRCEPFLQAIGKPKYFGAAVAAAAQVKLIGHVLVFGNLMAYSSAVALQTACFEQTLGDSAQVDFFDFLNAGAGGSRQWDISMRQGVAENVWDKGFLIKHAVVDCLYTLQLLQEQGLPDVTQHALIDVVLAFQFVLKQYPDANLATHAMVRELLSEKRAAFIEHCEQHRPGSSATLLTELLQGLPETIADSAGLEITRQDF